MGQEALDSYMEQMTGWKLRSTERLYIVYLCNFCAEYIMQNVGLDESQAGIKIAKRSTNILRYADDTTLMAES